MHLFHTWDQWKVIERGDITRNRDFPDEKERKIGVYVLQEKTCKFCGKVKQQYVICKNGF